MNSRESHDFSRGRDVKTFTISCDECVMQDSLACADCVVTFLCDREPDVALVIDADEERAVRLLHGAGLVPALRHQRRSGYRGPEHRTVEC